MDYAQIEALRERHPAWRMLRATHAPLLLSYFEGSNDEFLLHYGEGSTEHACCDVMRVIRHIRQQQYASWVCSASTAQRSQSS